MSLSAYKQKRDFKSTTEPTGSVSNGTISRRFVVQEHHASHLHFDFRFESEGVLKSWAVPKGFPASPGIRRLAIMTEDHPVEYLTFSGTIPEGNYGAGEMSIWDSGTYEWVAKGTVQDGLKRGKLELLLQGDRLNGQYDMIRTDDEKNEWLIIKTKSKKSLSNEEADAVHDDIVLAGSIPSSAPDPTIFNPMLADTVEEPFDDPGYSYELKWDGYRAILWTSHENVELYSRNHQKLLAKMPALRDARQWLNCDEALIDGEIVALDRNGRPDFQALQNHYGFRALGRKWNDSDKSDSADVKIVLMAFDIVYADGQDLSQVKLVDRRRYLKSVIKPGGPILYSDEVREQGKALFEQAQEQGLEGIMAKRLDSTYVQRRSSDWKKIKTHRTVDAVIAGYTESKAAGRPFASLILGAAGPDGLTFLGHVGTGWDHAAMVSLMAEMLPLESKTSPFPVDVSENGPAHWLKPELACEVKYAEITADGRLRQPVFVRLRPDKPSAETAVQGSIAVPAAHGERAEIQAGIEVLEQDSTAVEATILVDLHRLKLTNLDKIFWPATGTVKRNLLRYYAQIGPILLPHLVDRPLVIERYPNGVSGARFFQHDIGGKEKHSTPKGHPVSPSFLKTYDIVESNGLVHYPLCDELADLLYLVNLGTIPIHCWNITTKDAERPDRIVWDLDPGGEFQTVVAPCLAIKSVLDEIGLTSWAKTSGAHGLHIYVPIERSLESDTLIAFATVVAQTASSRAPKQMTLERRIAKRGASQVYVDCVQNRVGKTVVAPYSVRAQPTPTVSTPLRWEEVSSKLAIEDYTIDVVPDRLSSLGDLFEPFLSCRQELPPAIGRLAKIASNADDKVLNELVDPGKSNK